MKGWGALGDQEEEMGSVPGLAGVFQSMRWYGQSLLEGELDGGELITVKRLISSIFYLPLCLFCHIDHFLRPLQDPIQPPLGAKDTGPEENRYWPRSPG